MQETRHKNAANRLNLLGVKTRSVQSFIAANNY
jgi:hypothetical protein